MSLITALLLLRQKLANDGQVGISLQDKEMIDNNDWNEILKQHKEITPK